MWENNEEVFKNQAYIFGKQSFKLSRCDNKVDVIVTDSPLPLSIPVIKETRLKKNDIVFCKVKGKYYLHKISAIKNGVSYQISNNHGHVNGTIGRNNIYGVVVEIL